MSVFSGGSLCQHKGEEEEDSCLLSLLASRNGTTSAVSDAIKNGAIINEVHPSTEEGVVHVLLRRCVHPFELFTTLKVLVSNGADVNLRDYRGATPLSLLILHVNHGLRYHGYHLPEVKRMEDLGMPKSEIIRKVCGFDEEYQHQVYLSLELLLASGADVNAVSDVVPALPASSSWVETFEHKLIQQEGRWHLLEFDTSMEYSTYNIFSPVSSHRCPNVTKLTPLHLASWRGDANVIDLLLRYGANARSVASDAANSNVDRKADRGATWWSRRVESANVHGNQGRGMLHLLYLYCNKPRDLPEATKLLQTAGTDPNLLYKGQMAAHVLIRHVFVKRSYIQYLSNAYCLSEINVPQEKDNFIAEIIVCFNLLRGRRSELKGPVWDSMLSLLYTNFQATLANTDKEFQAKGHYLVPYTFQVEPLTEFSSYLIRHGAKVSSLDDAGQTPLVNFIWSLNNLCVSSTLNSPESLCSCVKVLLEGGEDCNRKDAHGRTAAHLLTLNILHGLRSREDDLVHLLVPLLHLLTQYGADLNMHDNLLNTPLFSVVDNLRVWWQSFRVSSLKMMYNLTEELVVCGADPSKCVGHIYYPLNVVLGLHDVTTRHSAHDTHRTAQLEQQDVVEGITHRLVRLLCGNMVQADLRLAVHTHCSRVDRLFANYIDQFQSEAVVCETCRVIYVGVTEPFTLKQICRRTIWFAMDNGRFRYGVAKLPLPTAICQYLQDFSQR